MKTAGAAV